MRTDLDSREVGITACDLDFIVHKYKTREDGKLIQCVMFIEVKTRGKDIEVSQSDTLAIIDQFLNNRCDTPTKKNSKRRTDGNRTQVYSPIMKRKVTVRAFGGYILQFEHTGPMDSQWIRWGSRRELITADQLAQLIRFDIDPDTLAPFDVRSHHVPGQMQLVVNSKL